MGPGLSGAGVLARAGLVVLTARHVKSDQPGEEHRQVELADDGLERGDHPGRRRHRDDVPVAHRAQGDEAQVEEQVQRLKRMGGVAQWLAGIGQGRNRP